MLRQMAEDHCILYLMLLSVMGLILGAIGIYLIVFIVAIFEIFEWISLVFTMGGG